MSMTAVKSQAQARSACACPACGAASMRIFFEVDNVPSNSCILLSTEEEAKAYPTGDVRMGFCDECGFVFNTAFNLALTEYSGRYEETQAFSGTFNKFHVGLAKRLIEKHHLEGKRVLEIGCGKGEFLVLLAELGNLHGVGVDPGVHPERIDSPAADRVEFIADFYREKHGQGDFDLVACKMTLEHIPNVSDFISTVRRGVHDDRGTVVFFMIPEAKRILSACAFEDIYYEHCSYFSAGSGARAFRKAGFDVTDVGYEYDGQYLTIEAAAPGAVPAPKLSDENDLAELSALVDSFPERCAKMISSWQKRVADWRAAGKTIALWGSGSKAVSFMTTMQVGDAINWVTDINPHRHGYFMPLTAQQIISPEALKELQPDVVIAMNPIYTKEIQAELDRLGVRAELTAL